MHVSIPTPCHEDWSQMTPTQQGAFCKTCAIDVIDFSHKNSEEVRETLLENSGKHLCGRFKKSQLEVLSQDYSAWRNQNTKTFQSKFLWACIMVFGFSLFVSCNSSNAAENNTFSTKLEQIISPPDSVEDEMMTTMGDIEFIEPEINLELFEQGELVYIEEEDTLQDEILMGDTITNVNEFLKGNIAIAPEQEDTTKEDKCKRPDTKDLPQKERMVFGKIVAPPKVDAFLADSTKNKIVKEEIVKDHLSAKVYPNPLQTYGTIVLEIDKTELYTIELYTFAGKKAFVLKEGILTKGKHEIELNMLGYAPGIYFIKIAGQNHRDIIKVNKVN